MWCIPPKENAAFVCQMEQVLEVYSRPNDEQYPVACMDETTKRCVKEVRAPLQSKPGRVACYDAEYERNGVAHSLLFYAPFENWRRIDIADNHKADQWAEGVRKLVQEDYAQAKKITLVMDNLNTHCGGSLYKTFEPQLAKSLMDKLEFIYTPKQGSWLNLAECEFSALGRQCLSRRLPDTNAVEQQVATWQQHRNEHSQSVNWRFSTDDARIKLKHLYPNLSV